MRWLVALALLASPALADERIGSFLLPDGDQSVIVLDGEIEEFGLDDFRTALSIRPAATTLILSSLGGYTQAGVQIGYEIRSRGLATYVPEDAVCASACVTVLMAGSPHKADGTVAVHQSTMGIEGGAALRSNVALVRALTEFGTPRGMIDALFATPNSGAYYFTRDELQLYGLAD